MMMMYTYNEVTMSCSAETAFRLARQVERWPELLAHYRRTSFKQGASDRGGGLVEMAAVRPFKRIGWPVWWESTMAVDESRRSVSYKHVRGVTRGMEVEWRLEELGEENIAVKISIVHRWVRPPFGRRFAAGMIGGIFVHAIAERTLQGLKRHAEQERAKEKEEAAYGQH